MKDDFTNRTKRKLTMVFLLSLLLICALGNSVSAAGSYTINGKTIRYSDFSSSPQECWDYANRVYKKIWGSNFSSDFKETCNMLRELDDSKLTLTTAHLKEYVSKASLGSSLRICNSANLHSHDGYISGQPGHNQIIVQKDSNGFTVIQGGLSASPYCNEKYYTWSEYCNTGWLGGTYKYIKYIKWPGAPAYNRPKYQGSTDPSKPTIQSNKSSYDADETATFTWSSTNNTTHYYLRFYKKTDGSYSKCVSNPQLTSAVHSYSASFSEGEYKLVVQAYNRGEWNSDHSDYKHADTEFFFTVSDTNPTAVVISGPSKGKPDERLSFSWTSTKNTTHYYLRFYKKTDGSYSKCVSNPQLTSTVHSYSASFSEGEYKLIVQAYNRGVWNSDHSDYKHVDSTHYFIVAQGTTPSTSNNNISNQGVKTASTSKPTKIIKKSQPMKVTVKKPSVKASKLKKKKQTIKLSKAFTIKNAQGVVTFTKKSGSKKLKISKNGKITVKKGTKKGKYKIRVIVTAAGNAKYKVGRRIVTVTVKVKK